MAQISPARKAAFAILMSVERGDDHSDDLLRGRTVSALSQQDRNLATALVLGVLRRQIALDRRIRALLDKPNAKLDAEVRIALRLGAFQILHMDRIPARAAIDESVELAKRSGHRFASGMVNAVLRKLTARPREQDEETAAYPQWMVERWTRLLGEDAACAVCHYGLAQPAVAIRLDAARVESELAAQGIELGPGKLLSRARIVIAGDVRAEEAVCEGRVRMQDEGSQLVAEIAGQGSAILDCCAAPGGKTLILAERNPDARIVACEASSPRLETLRMRVARLGGRIECRLADATALDYDSEFDVVLADVPCSGTGTLGRNPEIRHRLGEGDFARQAARQRLILASALRAARPGGRVVYSTCSLEPDENEQVVTAVLNEQGEARVADLRSRFAEMEGDGILVPGAGDRLRACVTPEGYLRLIPGMFGSDGFFVAVIRKP